VRQVVMGTTSTNVTNATTTRADTTLTATITPTSASSRILVLVTQAASAKGSANANNGINIWLMRGGTDIQRVADRGLITNTAVFSMTNISNSYLDSPGTTSATTYKTQFSNNFAGANVQVQSFSTAQSTIILIEVGP